MPRLLLLALLALAGCQSLGETVVAGVVAARRSEAGLSERTVTVEGRSVAYLERAGSEPALVLVHGFGAQKDAWLDLVDALPVGRRVLVPDLAGHGDTPAEPGARYDGPRYAADLVAWLEAVTDGPADLAGNSMGGLVVTLVALDHPQAVRSLVLLDPAGIPSPVPSGLDSLVATGANPLIPTTRAEYDRLLAFAFARPPDLPGLARDVLAADARPRAPFLRRLFEALGDTPGDLRARLPGLDRPVLLLWGTQDRVLDPSAAPLWDAAMPRSRYVRLPGVGHAPMMEAPETTARLMSGFLDTR